MLSSLWRSASLFFLCGFFLCRGDAARASEKKHGKRSSHEHPAAAHHKRSHERGSGRGSGRVEGAVTSAPPAAAPATAPEVMTTRGPTRLDFDDRVVQGQSNKAGAIFLYDRKSLPLRSMVREPDRFRGEIQAQLPDDEPASRTVE